MARRHPEEFLALVDAKPELRRLLRAAHHLSEADVQVFGEIRQAEYLAGLRERSTYITVDDRRRFAVAPSVDKTEMRRLVRSYKVASAMVESWLLFHREFLAG